MRPRGQPKPGPAGKQRQPSGRNPSQDRSHGSSAVTPQEPGNDRRSEQQAMKPGEQRQSPHDAGQAELPPPSLSTIDLPDGQDRRHTGQCSQRVQGGQVTVPEHTGDEQDCCCGRRPRHEAFCPGGRCADQENQQSQGQGRRQSGHRDGNHQRIVRGGIQQVMHPAEDPVAQRRVDRRSVGTPREVLRDPRRRKKLQALVLQGDDQAFAVVDMVPFVAGHSGAAAAGTQGGDDRQHADGGDQSRPEQKLRGRRESRREHRSHCPALRLDLRFPALCRRSHAACLPKVGSR